MSANFSNLPLFFLSLFFGIAMIVEGFIIVKMQKQIIPLPTKLLYWVSVRLSGVEKSQSRFAGKTSPDDLRTYAFFALVFGSALTLTSLIYLNSILS